MLLLLFFTLLLHHTHSTTPSCSIIHLRREISTHAHNRSSSNHPFHLLRGASLQLSLANCLEQHLPSTTNTRVLHHLTHALTLSKRAMDSSTAPVWVLHSATLTHAQTLLALNRPVTSRSYLRLLLRLLWNRDNDNAPALHASLAQAELHICTSSRFPIHLCNISAVVHHSRWSLLSSSAFHPPSQHTLLAATPEYTSSTAIIPWGDIFKRTGSSVRTHIIPLHQKIKHDLHQATFMLQLNRHRKKERQRNKGARPRKRTHTEISASTMQHFQHMHIHYHKLLIVLKRHANETNWNVIDASLNALLDSQTKAVIASTYGKYIYVPHAVTPPPPLPCRSPLLQLEHQDVRRIETAFAQHGYTVVDNVLTSNTMVLLQQYINQAFIFHDPRMGYIGAYANSGLLLDPTFVLLATAMGRSFPNILCGRPLVVRCFPHPPHRKIKTVVEAATLHHLPLKLWLAFFYLFFSPSCSKCGFTNTMQSTIETRQMSLQVESDCMRTMHKSI